MASLKAHSDRPSGTTTYKTAVIDTPLEKYTVVQAMTDAILIDNVEEMQRMLDGVKPA